MLFLLHWLSEGLWQEATRIVPVFVALLDYANFGKESLENVVQG